jgi:hypothetical protein
LGHSSEVLPGLLSFRGLALTACPLRPPLCRAVRPVTPRQVEEVLAAVTRSGRANLRDPQVCADSAIREVRRMLCIWGGA